MVTFSVAYIKDLFIHFINKRITKKIEIKECRVPGFLLNISDDLVFINLKKAPAGFLGGCGER